MVGEPGFEPGQLACRLDLVGARWTPRWQAGVTQDFHSCGFTIPLLPQSRCGGIRTPKSLVLETSALPIELRTRKLRKRKAGELNPQYAFTYTCFPNRPDEPVFGYLP